MQAPKRLPGHVVFDSQEKEHQIWPLTTRRNFVQKILVIWGKLLVEKQEHIGATSLAARTAIGPVRTKSDDLLFNTLLG
jgi:hypothetical protein